jgi:Na+-translocating ferredoxin:NAD+ oxidoreductase RnfA subunit|tara:strand:+ start:322 stop:465 length:144 start_codon:yes stop_codon:yes gene_type:complete
MSAAITVYLKILIFIDVITAFVKSTEMLVEKNFTFLNNILGVLQSGR